MPASISDRDFNRWFPVFCAILSFALFLPFAPLGIDPHHDGVMLKPAMDVLSGQVLFRDTFNQYGALSTYLQALALAILGPRLWSLKVFTIFMYAVAGGFLVSAWIRAFKSEAQYRWIAASSFLSWLAFVPFYSQDWTLLPWSSVYALVFQAMSVDFALRAPSFAGNEGARPIWSFWAGVAAALAFWCRQPVGTFLIASIGAGLLIAIARNGRKSGSLRDLLFFAVGGGGIFAIFVAEIALTGAYEQWILQNFVWPRRWAAEMYGFGFKALYDHLIYCQFGSPRWEWMRLAAVVIAVFLALRYLWKGPFRIALCIGLAAGTYWGFRPFLKPPALESIESWAIVIPVAVLVAAFVLLGKYWRESSATNLGLLLFSGVCLASWLQYYPVVCPRHVFWGISPALGFFAYLMVRLSGRKTGWALAAMIILMMPLVKHQWQLASEKLALNYREVPGIPVLEGMRAGPDNLAELLEISQVIREFVASHPNAALHTDGQDALYATFVPNLRNATPFYLRWPGLPVDGEYSGRRARFIARERPLVLVDQKLFSNLIGETVRDFSYTIAHRGPRPWVLLAPN